MEKVHWTFFPANGHTREDMPWTIEQSRIAKRGWREIGQDVKADWAKNRIGQSVNHSMYYESD